MEKSTVNLDNPVAIREVTIIPVVRVSLHYSFAAGISVMSTKQPIAAVILSPSQKKVFRISGEEVTLEQLAEEFPILREPLEKA